MMYPLIGWYFDFTRDADLVESLLDMASPIQDWEVRYIMAGGTFTTRECSQLLIS